MLSFRKIIIEGFRSFGDKTTIMLDGKGLIYVGGKNGAGKSTIFDAAYWCCFGKTSRGLRAGSVASWSGKRCRVVLYFDDDTTVRKLVRTWKPITLTLDGSPTSQEALESVLGYTPDTFLFSTYHAQFSTHFCDLGATKQLEVFTELLKLDLWDSASDKAAALEKQYESKLENADTALDKKNSILTELLRELDEKSAKEAEWLRLRKSKLAALKKEIETLLEGAVHVENEITKLISNEPESVKDSKLDELRDSLAEYNSARAKLDQQISREEEDLDSFNKTGTCPLCGQDVMREHLKSRYVLLKKLREEREEFKWKIESSKEAERSLLKKKEEATATYRKALELYERKRAELISERKRYNDLGQAAGKQLLELQQEDCPFDTRELTTRVAALREECDVIRSSQNVAKRSLGRAQFWVKAFKHIRLMLINKHLLQFEVQANDALAQLGLDDWYVRFDIEKDNKSGTIRRGFTIEIESPDNKGLVPFEVWSGGETQRLRLAISFAFADLIEDVSGARCNLEIYDEPTNFLTEEGIVSLMDALHKRAERRAVWLIDHRTLEHGGFSSSYGVVKGKHGSVVH